MRTRRGSGRHHAELPGGAAGGQPQGEKTAAGAAAATAEKKSNHQPTNTEGGRHGTQTEGRGHPSLFRCQGGAAVRGGQEGLGGCQEGVSHGAADDHARRVRGSGAGAPQPFHDFAFYRGRLAFGRGVISILSTTIASKCLGPRAQHELFPGHGGAGV